MAESLGEKWKREDKAIARFASVLFTFLFIGLGNSLTLQSATVNALAACGVAFMIIGAFAAFTFKAWFGK